MTMPWRRNTHQRVKPVRILFIEDKLRVEFGHWRIPTEVDEENLRTYAQMRYKQRTGEAIPLEEFEVSPKTGEKSPTQTTFMVALNQPLYIGLNRIFRDDPKSCRRIISALTRYLQKQQLTNAQEQLVNYTLNELAGKSFGIG